MCAAIWGVAVHMLGHADRVLVQQVRSGPGGQLGGRAGAAEGHHGLPGEVGDGIGVGGKGSGTVPARTTRSGAMRSVAWPMVAIGVSGPR
jgi:hypothetical protein